MNHEVGRLLKSFIDTYGTSVALDPLRCEGLLRDTCPRCNQEIFVLVNAVRQQVPADLLSPRHTLPAALFREFLIKRLKDEVAFSEEAAQWAVDTWAVALNLEIVSPREGVTPDPAPVTIPGAGNPQNNRVGDAGELTNLIRDLGNASWRVRESAFDTLVASGDAAIPVLLNTLSDSREQLKINAIIALGALRARDAIPRLVVFLDSKGELPDYAAWALGEIGDDRAVTPLTRLLNRNDEKIRSIAEEALRKFGGLVPDPAQPSGPNV